MAGLWNDTAALAWFGSFLAIARSTPRDKMFPMDSSHSCVCLVFDLVMITSCLVAVDRAEPIHGLVLQVSAVTLTGSLFALSLMAVTSR